ncbi:MAG: site-2 protease family protein [Candidatus Eremiobacteraeota bacterium]|nr:site-2 protease family protein [Candidatus Eremiobacteraeota bacterium]MBV8671076.1 site-2 protease family protein [Candidatus Eremiobacteraeota bacterium]
MLEIVFCSLSLTLVLTGIAKFALFLALISVLILFHEFGHFVFAKSAGVTVTDFALGFGPTLLSTRRGDTTYRINALPLGGYCKMVGEDQADDGSADPGNFQRKSWGARFAIIVAGPIFNLILAALIFTFIGAVLGIQTGVINVVKNVIPGTPAASAGLQPGDQIVELDGRPVRSGNDMYDYIHGNKGKVIAVDVARGSRIIHLHILAKPTDEGGTVVGAFGFQAEDAIEHKPFVDAVVWGVSMVGVTAVGQTVAIGEAIAHHDSSALHGPVGIARIVTGTVQYGLRWILTLTATLSVVLGVVNLFPFPALDGGRLAFLVVELARGRPVDPEKEGLAHLAGFALLMVFVVFVTYHDIVQWVQGKGGL